MFKLLQYEFVQNAFMAGTIIAILAPIIGYFVVVRAQAFAGHALSHIGFAGATGAALLGVNPLLGMFTFTLLAALAIGALGERVRGRDVETGMALSFALGLGVLFLSLYSQYSRETVSILFGSILSISHDNVLITLAGSIAALLLILLMFRPLLFASIDPVVAESRGVPVRLLSIGFLLLLAVTVSVAVQVVGVLLVFALLVAPAATAGRLTHRPISAIALGILLGLAFTWGGLVLAIASRWPVSFCIAALASLCYVITVLRRSWRTPHRYKALPHPNREYV